MTPSAHETPAGKDCRASACLRGGTQRCDEAGDAKTAANDARHWHWLTSHRRTFNPDGPETADG
jgi:hypothetical protein